jgi:hypothetical protein
MYTKKYVLRNSPVIMSKVCTVAVYRYKTNYRIFAYPKKYVIRIIPINISKVKHISLETYSLTLNVLENTNKLAVHHSTEYSMYMAHNRLHTASPPPTRRPTANKVRGRGCQQWTCKQCTAGKQTLYSMGCQYSTRHRGGRNASTGRIVYMLYCINCIYILGLLRTNVCKVHTVVKRLPNTRNVFAIAAYIFENLTLPNNYYAVSRVPRKNYTPRSMLMFSKFRDAPLLQFNSRISLYTLCMEVDKKYNLSVRKLFGKMSEPGERKDGGGSGKSNLKSPCTISSINMPAASKTIVTYRCLTEDNIVCSISYLIMCYTSVLYIIDHIFALCLFMSFCAVTFSNCSSRHGE